MKKALMLMLALCTLAIFSACNPANQVSQVYSVGNEKMNQLDSFDMNSDISINITSQGESLDIPIIMDMKAVNIKSNPEYLINMSTKMMGMQTDSQIYFKDATVYLSTAGVKYKQAMSLEDMKKNYASVDINILDEELLKQATLTKTATGPSITLNLKNATVNSDTMKKIFDIDSMLQNFGTISSISYNKLLATLNYNNEGYLTSEVIEYEMSCTIDNSVFTIAFKGTFNINNPGQAVIITPPADLNTYAPMS